MRTLEAWEEKVGEVTARGGALGEKEPLCEGRGCPDGELGGGVFPGPQEMCFLKSGLPQDGQF